MEYAGLDTSLLKRGMRDLSGSAEESRDAHIVACAAALFLKDGLGEVRMTDIADASGIGVATLYRRFSTKTNLAIAAATLLWQRFNDRIMDIVE